jgi:hypothetical protein
MNKIINFGIVVLCVLVLAAGQIFGETTPLRGRGAGQITGVTPVSTGVEITAIGSGNATQLGRFTRSETILLNPSTGMFTGTMTYVAANGDELNCTFSGAFTSQTTASGVYTFSGGTGRFADASGQADFNILQSDQVNFTFNFAGAIETE